MSEIDKEVVRRLVMGRKNDGRAVYDPKAKAEVVRACMKPGVSVARMALQCGVNANLLRRWITDCGFHCAGRSVPEHICDPMLEAHGRAPPPAEAQDPSPGTPTSRGSLKK